MLGILVVLISIVTANAAESYEDLPDLPNVTVRPGKSSRNNKRKRDVYEDESTQALNQAIEEEASETPEDEMNDDESLDTVPSELSKAKPKSKKPARAKGKFKGLSDAIKFREKEEKALERKMQQLAKAKNKDRKEPEKEPRIETPQAKRRRTYKQLEARKLPVLTSPGRIASCENGNTVALQSGDLFDAVADESGIKVNADQIKRNIEEEFESQHIKDGHVISTTADMKAQMSRSGSLAKLKQKGDNAAATVSKKKAKSSAKASKKSKQKKR